MIWAAELPTKASIQCRDRGQAAVETALVLPLLLAAVLALVQVGLLVRDHVLLVHATREAARAAAVDPTAETATAAAMAATELDPARLHVDIAGSRSAGSRLRIAVSYRPKLEVPIVGRLFPAVTIREELTIRVE